MEKEDHPEVTPCPDPRSARPASPLKGEEAQAQEEQGKGRRLASPRLNGVGNDQISGQRLSRSKAMLKIGMASFPTGHQANRPMGQR